MSQEFSIDVKNRVLLWCDRHCCLCKKDCGVDIEVHHIIPKENGGDGSIENAIPLCFDCHAKVHRTGKMGNTIKSEEMIARRDQIFDEFTAHLISPIMISLSQLGRTFPNIGFNINHTGSIYPQQALVTIASIIEGKEVSFKPSETPYYSGKHSWNLNPRKGFSGHFNLPEYMMPKGFIDLPDKEKDKLHLELRIKVTLIDIYQRQHHLLPEGFVFSPLLGNDVKWYAEP